LFLLFFVRFGTPLLSFSCLGNVHTCSILSHNLHVDFHLSVTHLISLSEPCVLYFCVLFKCKPLVNVSNFLCEHIHICLCQNSLKCVRYPNSFCYVYRVRFHIKKEKFYTSCQETIKTIFRLLGRGSEQDMGT
jgi:hypothetical protein